MYLPNNWFCKVYTCQQAESHIQLSNFQSHIKLANEQLPKSKSICLKRLFILSFITQLFLNITVKVLSRFIS